MSMTPITIRDATPADADALCSVILAAFEQYRGQLSPASGAHDETPASIAAKLARGTGVIAQTSHGLIVGGAVCYFDAEKAAWYLGRLAVLPAYRGQGIAHRIVARYEQQGLAQGYHEMLAGVRKVLSDNVSLFEGLGYSLRYETNQRGETLWLGKTL